MRKLLYISHGVLGIVMLVTLYTPFYTASLKGCAVIVCFGMIRYAITWNRK